MLIGDSSTNCSFPRSQLSFWQKSPEIFHKCLGRLRAVFLFVCPLLSTAGCGWMPSGSGVSKMRYLGIVVLCTTLSAVTPL